MNRRQSLCKICTIWKSCRQKHRHGNQSQKNGHCSLWPTVVYITNFSRYFVLLPYAYYTIFVIGFELDFSYHSADTYYYTESVSLLMCVSSRKSHKNGHSLWPAFVLSQISVAILFFSHEY